MSNDDSTTSGAQSPLLTAFLEHKRMLAAYIARYFLRPEDVDDILQESFARSFDASGRTTIDSPKSYLFMTARNLVYHQLRQQSRFLKKEVAEIDEIAGPAADASLEAQVHDERKMAVFVEAARSLPPQCRRVFLMRKFYGLSHREIAAQLNISQSTVERHITNAIKRCRDIMQRQGYGAGTAAAPGTATDNKASG